MSSFKNKVSIITNPIPNFKFYSQPSFFLDGPDDSILF